MNFFEEVTINMTFIMKISYVLLRRTMARYGEVCTQLSPAPGGQNSLYLPQAIAGAGGLIGQHFFGHFGSSFGRQLIQTPIY